jgi:hypothetical protein
MADLILTQVHRKLGKLNHEDIYDITFVDIETLEIYMTVVDSSYRNYTRSGWDRIVSSENPYGLYSGLRKTAKRNTEGFTVVSADSHPQLIEPIAQRDLFGIIDGRREQLGIE